MEAITPNAEDIIGALKTLIRAIGEDPDREGLIGTPDRIMRMWKEIFRGYDPKQKPKITTFANEEGMSDIVFDCGDYYSMCEHHILPFFGRVSVGYIPDGEMIGLSKLARAVNVYARRLQVQERLTAEICASISRSLHTKGVIVACNAQHLCMKMRGVEKQDSSTTTIEYNGLFSTPEMRAEFFSLLRDIH